MIPKLGTFCSGIGAPEVAEMGDPVWFSEIEAFPCEVLAHRFPGVPNLGDMTAGDLVERIAAIALADLIVAGLPCQPFSVAGLRKGEADPRNLTSRFVEIADAIDDLRRAAGKPPAWWLVENVPGLLSDPAFGALLGGLCGADSAIDAPATGWSRAGVVAGPRRVVAWRVLDAQHFGVAQRRRRVFILAVGHPGGWAAADALLPIARGMSGHHPPRRGKGQGVAALTATGVGTCGADDNQAQAGHLVQHIDGGDTSRTLSARYDGSPCVDRGPDIVATRPALPMSHGDGQGGAEIATDSCPTLTCNHEAPIAAYGVALRGREGGATAELTDGISPALRCGGGGGDKPHVLAFSCKDHGADASETAPTLRAMGHNGSHANAGGQVAVAIQERSVSENLDNGPGGKGYSDDGAAYTLEARSMAQAVAFAQNTRDEVRLQGGDGQISGALSSQEGMNQRTYLASPMAVRRLMPVECEKLQGFPPSYTAIPWRGKPADQCPDGPRYRAIGNSMAVNVMSWIGQRIAMADAVMGGRSQ